MLEGTPVSILGEDMPAQSGMGRGQGRQGKPADTEKQKDTGGMKPEGSKKDKK